MGDEVDGAHQASKASCPLAQEDSERRPMKRGPLTTVACDACRKRKSKCDGARPICSTCRAKKLPECVYEASLDGSRIQQLRRDNQDLKDEVASLQTQVSQSWAAHELVKQQRDGSLVPKLSPTSDHHPQLHETLPYSSADFEARFWEIRAEDIGQRALFTNRLSGSGTDGFDSVAGLRGLQSRLPIESPALKQAEDANLPMHMLHSSTQSHDSPVSKVYTSFRNYARHAIATGEPEGRVLGSFEINAGVIFSNSNFENASYLSQWAGQVVSAWGFQSLAPKIGMMHLVFQLMRWQVSSSPQDFNDLPEIMRPTSTQISTPHPPYIDFLLWPHVRDLFINNAETYSPLQWNEKIAQTLNLAQDFSIDEVLYCEPSTGHFRMQETFRNYVEDADHWTLDPALAEMIPELQGKVRFR